MTIFLLTDYRLILRERVKSGVNKDGKSLTFQELAGALRMQSSNLSRVMNGTSDLSQDQMALACRFLKLNRDETNYLFLLLERDRSALFFRKEELSDEIEAIRARHLQTQQHVDVRSVEAEEKRLHEYFRSPLLQIIHVALFIPRFAKDPLALAPELGLPTNKVEQILDELTSLGIIARKDGRAKIVINDLHLPREHQLFEMWKLRLQQLSQHHLASGADPDAYTFSVVFTAEETTRKRVLNRFFVFLQEAKDLTAEVDPTSLYQIDFNLFSWIRKREAP